MLPRLLSCAIAVGSLVLTHPWTAAARQQNAPDNLSEWLHAVDAHEPGHPGRGALLVGSWAGEALEAVIVRARAHARTLVRTDRARANDLLLRGAVMHADLARLIPDDAVRRSPRQQSIFMVNDGRWEGTRYPSLHWGLGRALLEDIAPSPSSHPGVREWYIATSRDLLRLRAHSEAVTNLTRARQLFPADVSVLLMSGILHERFASAVLQAAAESLLQENRTPSIGSSRAELVRAERMFRDLLAVDPRHLEARVRRAHVLGGIGRHAEAAAELRHALEQGVDGDLRYYAWLLLGRQEEALGRAEPAERAFLEAARLHPDAQTPRLALSQLARRAGRRVTAQRELQHLARAAEDARLPEDPWWGYYEHR